MTVFQTQRLTLREFTFDDTEFILKLLNDPSFIRFIGDRNVRSVEDARKYLKGPMVSYERNSFGLWAVEDKASRTLLGMCGLIKRDTLPDVDIGYAFLPEFHSQGYAFEAANASMGYAKETLKLPRILAIVSPQNERSIRLLEKLGMKFERMFTMPNEDEELKLFTTDYWQSPKERTS